MHVKTIDCWIQKAVDQSENEAIGQALEACRPYLMVMAKRSLSDDLRAKEDASDIVQETFLEAHRDFDRFQGRSADELRAWLCCILRHNLLNLVERYRKTEKRRLDREVSIDRDSAVCRAAEDVAARTPSPEDQAIRREQRDALRRSMGRLPKNDRKVLTWRHQEQHSFEEIGQRLEISTEAARKVWSRAVRRLQREVEREDTARPDRP